MGELTLGLVQMRCEKGAIEYNIISMYKYLEECRNKGVDIVCFPEMNISGCINPLKYSNALLSMFHPSIQRIADMSFLYQTIIIAGFAEKNYGGKPYITQFVAKDGKIEGCYRKRTLRGDQSKWFSPGTKPFMFRYSGYNFGLTISQDIYDGGIFKEYAERGASLVFESAAPGLSVGQGVGDWEPGFSSWKNECKSKLGKYAAEDGIFIAAATQAGRTCDEDFPGGGYVFAPDGRCMYEMEDGEEGMLVAKIQLN
ncbi:MAG TPA: carbon-nitrogen hydrolase family protein [Bacillota bacterium]|nr:carbon-nitrogen hydrolase family protein [Clostridiaceae bacterium]HNR04732.1 carbon-nitrogen hydrolase family protein [Bacillota bacterium]HPA54719.1 carbon-nitrogen hydrolase family protein [Bacillota bacterium]HPX69812.1 carbon-nitrogen hydrolase family protein [Bacillota bacterium]HQO43348.1 carbon-nitrogen hydrolase family protein [Bacillota bacterium]